MTERRRLTWYRTGMVGALVLVACALLNLLASLPRMFIEPWTWQELVFLPTALVVIGFVCGAIVGWMLPLSRRIGVWGDAVIGAFVGPAYLFLCLAIFEPTAFDIRYIPWGTFLLLMSALIGGSFAVAMGHDVRMGRGADETGRKGSTTDEA